MIPENDADNKQPGNHGLPHVLINVQNLHWSSLHMKILCEKKGKWEKSKKAEVVCVIFYFLCTAGKAVEHLSGVPPRRNPHQTVVNRGHGACSMLFSHRTGVVCVLLCDPSYCVMLPRELPLPSDCWSVLPLSLSQETRQLSFLNMTKTETAFIYLMNTTNKQNAWYIFHPLEVQSPALWAVFGWFYRNGNGKGFRTWMTLFLESPVTNYSFNPPPPGPSLVAPWILPGWLSQSHFMGKSTSRLTGVFTQPIRLLQVWDSYSPAWVIASRPPPALFSTGWVVRVCVCAFSVFIHSLTVRRQILDTHTCLLTVTCRWCNMEQQRIHGRNSDSHTCTHTHTPICLA